MNEMPQEHVLNVDPPESEGVLIGEEGVDKIIKEVSARFAPFFEQIKQMRISNSDREIGGKIGKDGSLVLADESRSNESSVTGESPEREREMADEGVLSFHTHTDQGFTSESGSAIVAAYYRYCEVFFHKDGVSCIIALKRLTVDAIRKIDREAWNQALGYAEENGDPAYWYWKGALMDRLPVRVVKIDT